MKHFLSLLVFFILHEATNGQAIKALGLTTFCAGGNVTLNVNPTNGITGYQWIRDSIDIPSATGAAYVATLSGSYTVRLNRGALGDTTIGKIIVTSNPIPAVPSFTFTKNNQCASLPFTFSIASPVAGIVYAWDFGDLSFSTGADVSHVYKAIGNGLRNYNVSVKATSAAGCTSSEATQAISLSEKPDTRLDGPNPTAYKDKNYFRSCSSDSSVIFDFGNASTNSTNTGYKIIWGDGTLDTAFNTFTLVSHPYSIGTYPMLFIVSGTNGCSDTAAYFNFVGSNPAVGLNNPGNTTICTGTSLTFPITGTSSNTPGTTYTVTFNDGTVPIIFNNIAPSDITHTFPKESCGTTTQTTPSYTNSFSATIQASNPCLTSAATVVPIYVSGKPSANFTPDDTVCINSLATIVNTSVNNNYINAPNCTSGRFVWTITPSAGWTIVSGNLGSDNGSPSPGSWSSSATNALGLNFTQTGIYSVRLKVGNPVCGKDSILKNICVNPVPVAAFNIDENIGCAPLKVKAINIPSTNNCGSNTYKWSVNYVSTFGCKPDTADFIYLNGTNGTSVNPEFQFNSPGVYTISLVAISPGGTCTSAIVSKTVTVKSKPIVSVTIPSSVCINEPVSPSSTLSCYITSATYAWSFPGGNVTSSNKSTPDPVTYSTAGNTAITLDVTNECGTTSITKPIAINTVTLADAGLSQNKCGSSITMAANTPVVGTGMWTKFSGPNNPFIANPSSPVTSITGLIPGTYVFKWTIANGNCTSSSNVTITISPGPGPSDAGFDQRLCLDTSTTLKAQVPTIGIGAWSQIGGPAAAIIVNADSNITNVNGLIPGVYIFRWTVNFSNCTPGTDDMQVTILDNPTKADAGSDQIICVQHTTLTGNTPAIGTGLWSLVSGPNIPSIIAPSSPATVVTGLITGTYLFKWTISNAPCFSSQDTVQVNVTAITSNSLNGNQAICINTSAQNITGSTPAGGDGTYNYLWQQSDDGGDTWNIINNANEQDYNPGVLIQTMCYRREVTTAFCSDSSAAVSSPICITVNPDAKAQFIASDTILCPGINLNKLITVTPFPQGNLQYNWYANDILIAGNTTGAPPFYLFNSPGQQTDIKLVTTNKFNCLPDSMHINFRTLPSVTARFTKDTAAGCGPVMVSFTNTSSILDSTIKFYWNFGDGRPIQNILQPAPVTYSSSAGFRDTIYYVTLKAFSGCDTTVWRDSVKVFADPQARFTSSATGCSPFRDTILNNSVGNNFAYYWDFGDGKRDTTFTNQKLVHNYNTGIVDTFTLSLIAVNGCRKDTQSMNLVVSPNNIQSQISVNGNELFGCAPHTVNFINGSAGATLLYFNYGDGTPEEVIPNTQSVITHSFLKGGIDTVKIRLVNNCTDTMITRYVTVYAQPASSFTIDNKVICTGNGIATSNTSQNANSYEWIWGDNTTTSSFNATHTYSNGGVYNVRLVARRVNNFGIACEDTSAAIAVNVVDRIPAVVNIGSANRCVPYTMSVSAANAANAAVVDWYFYDSNVAPGIFHITGPAASYTYNFIGTDSVKLVIENLAGCKDSTTEHFIVHKTPVVNLTPFNIKTCNTDTTVIFSASLNYDGTDPVSYKWYINDQLLGLSNPFSHNFQVPAGTTSVNNFAIKVLPQNSFGCGDTTAFGNFIIQTLAPQHITVSPSLVQEQPNYTFRFTDTSLSLSNTTYLWNPGGRNLQQLSGREVTYVYGDTGMYKVSLLVTDYETGCIQTDTTTVTILAVPGYLYVPNAFCPGCQKAELRNFLPLGKGLKDYHLTIFNIYGQKIFETTHLNANGIPDEPWDGNWPANKLNAQQDAYSWHIEAHYINGTEWKGMNNKKSGFITIIR